jgi:hypothetical protein
MAFAVSAWAAEVSRTWTDAKGRAVEAVFAGIEGDQVLLRTVDGAIHKVPMANLSENDRKLAISLPPPVVSLAIDGEISKAAAKIDEIIGRELAKQGLKPNPLCNDETYVRRAYLDIAGRTPNYDEVSAFLADTSPPNARSWWINCWTPMVTRATSSTTSPTCCASVMQTTTASSALPPYINWLRQQLREDAPYDQTVAQMLTATGKAWGNGATGYLLRDSGMVLDNLANTFSIFLGTDVACAQCHDHPLL